MTRRRIVLVAAIGATLLVGGGIAGIAWYRNSAYSSANLRFDGVRWKATARIHAQVGAIAHGGQPPARARSGRDSRNEIVDLLGEPGDSGGYFRDYELVYFLGLKRDSYFAIDGEWLILNVDENGIATEARLTTD